MASLVEVYLNVVAVKVAVVNFFVVLHRFDVVAAGGADLLK